MVFCICMANQLYKLSYELDKKRRTRIFILIIMAISVFIAIEIVLSFLIFPVRQKSSSMNPDIAAGSCVFVTPLEKNPSRGNVVLLKPLNEVSLTFFQRCVNTFVLFFTAQQYSPYGKNDDMGNNMLLRRVVGVPGDTIYMRDHMVFVKTAGEKNFLTEYELVLVEGNPYNTDVSTSIGGWENDIGVSGNFSAFTLREGQFFVLGDKRLSSLDSRVWGVITSSQIMAKALMVYYPFNKIKFL